MDDEQPQQQSDYLREEYITKDRQDELWAARKLNLAEGNPPWAGVTFRERADIEWVIEAEKLESYETYGIYGHEDPAPVLNFRSAVFASIDLSGLDLNAANFSQAKLSNCDLSRAGLFWADLGGADLSAANLRGTNLRCARLSGADLRGARLDAETRLNDAILDTRTLLLDVVWGDTPMTQLNWDDLSMLGDEMEARDPEGRQRALLVGTRTWGEAQKAVQRSNHQVRDLNHMSDYERFDAMMQFATAMSIQVRELVAYQDALTASRQVATELRSRGLYDQADRFAYRAQLCRRVVLRRRLQFLRYSSSLVLDIIAGYGYRPLRSVVTYLLVVVVFAALYLGLGGAHGQSLHWNEALVVSLTAFHGRGFFATAFQPGDPQAALAAIEAVFGLLIEITFIATFTNRFFAR